MRESDSREEASEGARVTLAGLAMAIGRRGWILDGILLVDEDDDEEEDDEEGEEKEEKEEKRTRRRGMDRRERQEKRAK